MHARENSQGRGNEAMYNAEKWTHVDIFLVTENVLKVSSELTEGSCLLRGSSEVLNCV
jgi:hypothetical protein